MDTDTEVKQIKELACKLSSDIVTYAVEKQRGIPLRTSDYYLKNVRIAVDYLLERHQVEFMNIAKKFSGIQPICEGFARSADKMFEDEVYNWWRIFTLYACAACLADLCAERRDGANLVKKLGKTLGRYTSDNLTGWIFSQGGWVRLPT